MCKETAYEVMDIPSRYDSSNTLENNPHTDLQLPASKQKQPRASYTPHEYLTPVTITNQRVLKCDEQTDVCTTKDEENTYQPLIPPRTAVNDDTSEYQSLTQLTLFKDFNLPPPIPPKPDAKHNQNRGKLP